ncbi:Regulatory-associated protein of mTOR [Trichoplax sp. H2]|nr:Regulatory-associated protein of mTOR [Trichoplax sp. H2]|eukprot:RDD45269.1 Regulatory-associated protein of mTOR [Trichoplax sp. H2]
MEEDEGNELRDFNVPIFFNQPRHTEDVRGLKMLEKSWKMTERMKTVSVALVLCLNVGVDPPDLIKPTPCARLECWLDPLTMNPNKSLEAVGNSLQKQYERWQPKARYKQSLDPTVEEVKKLCLSLRRNAKDDRVLFHYNGHGVPRPTQNGEIWVFNKNYTQYIPLSIYDLQSWIAGPTVFTYDCSNAGAIIDHYLLFCQQRREESPGESDSDISVTLLDNCIHMASCSSNEVLPLNPDLPADLFTSCLTTPIKTALRWFCINNNNLLVPNITLEMIEKIPGKLNDRRTPIGELNWIFTAVTDTIAWNVLPTKIFQKLFRQDLLVASLFRNFLLAERIMRSFNCSPTSHPKLPSTHSHPMWYTWDLVLDRCLSQLPSIINNGEEFAHSTFFEDQLTAFQVWLALGSKERNVPEQLPVVLQVLLSQIHRIRALDLLGKFLDFGVWAVELALSVGIFPYVLRLLQSSARELKPRMLFIWTKILAHDISCQVDLVKDGAYKYFLQILADSQMPSKDRAMAAYIMAMVIKDYPTGKEAAQQSNIIAICTELLDDPNPLLRQWVVLCLGYEWNGYDPARWCAVRDNAYEKLSHLLADECVEVRASVVYALGTFVSNKNDRNGQADNIDQGIGMTLAACVRDGSPVVRKELVVALSGFVLEFESYFISTATKLVREVESEKDKNRNNQSGPGAPGGRVLVPNKNTGLTLHQSTDSSHSQQSRRSRLSMSQSNNSLSPATTGDYHPALERLLSLPPRSVYNMVWRALITLLNDPFPEISDLGKELCNYLMIKITAGSSSPTGSLRVSESVSTDIGGLDDSALHAKKFSKGIERSQSQPQMPITDILPHSQQFSNKRTVFGRGPSNSDSSDDDTDNKIYRLPNVKTELGSWCSSQFRKSLLKPLNYYDPSSQEYYESEWKYLFNAEIRAEAAASYRYLSKSQLDDECFIQRSTFPPQIMTFMEYQKAIIVAGQNEINVWNWEQSIKMKSFRNSLKNYKITALEVINEHHSPLLLAGTDDGSLRLWKHFDNDDNNLKLVTAWKGLSEMLRSSFRRSGLVMSWEQQSGKLLCSGDVKSVSIWDVRRETKVQEIPTGAGSCVTSISSGVADRSSLLVVGCGDGSVRLFDRRLPANESRVKTLFEHKAWVVKVHRQSGGNGNIISGSIAGDVKFWDPRFTESVKTIDTQHTLNAMDVHKEADILVCGSTSQVIHVYNHSGELNSAIKYHDGFRVQKIGPISCLAFHPYKVMFAAGSADCLLSVYSPSDKRR